MIEPSGAQASLEYTTALRESYARSHETSILHARHSRFASVNKCYAAPIMDIDDILADVDRHVVPQENQDLQALTRAWVAERVAPELQPYPESLMSRTMAAIASQVRPSITPSRRI